MNTTTTPEISTLLEKYKSLPVLVEESFSLEKEASERGLFLFFTPNDGVGFIYFGEDDLKMSSVVIPAPYGTPAGHRVINFDKYSNKVGEGVCDVRYNRPLDDLILTLCEQDGNDDMATALVAHCEKENLTLPVSCLTHVENEFIWGILDTRAGSTFLKDNRLTLSRSTPNTRCSTLVIENPYNEGESNEHVVISDNGRIMFFKSAGMCVGIFNNIPITLFHLFQQYVAVFTDWKEHMVRTYATLKDDVYLNQVVDGLINNIKDISNNGADMHVLAGYTTAHTPALVH